MPLVELAHYTHASPESMLLFEGEVRLLNSFFFVMKNLLSDDKINLIREQIQQDILSFASVIDDEKIFLNDKVLDELCQIVVDNFEAFNK